MLSLAERKSARYFQLMSSVGFETATSKEIEKLREAWKALNDLLRNLNSAEVCLGNRDLTLTASHLKNAKWYVGEVKKAIKFVGESKHQQPD